MLMTLKQKKNERIIYTFLGNCPHTPPLLSQHYIINTYVSFRAKCWLKEGVGGQFPRNV